MKQWYLLVYAGLGVCVAVLLSAGVLAFIPAVACALVMGIMIWMTVWPDGHRGRGSR